MGLLIRIIVVFFSLTIVSGCALFGESTLDEEIAMIDKGKGANRKQVQKLKSHFDAGERLYAEGNLVAAEAEYKAMLEIKMEEEHALYRLGTIAFKRGDYAISAEYFERTIATNPRSSKAQYNLASIRLMQAENHFKYYAALADKNADLEKISRLLGQIDEFATQGGAANSDSTLDRIAGEIKK